MTERTEVVDQGNRGRFSRLELGACIALGIALLGAVLMLLPSPVEFSQTRLVAEGMTFDEVRGLLGPPEETPRNQDGTTDWIYYFDYYGLGGFIVDFDREGRVDGASTF